MDVQLEDIPGAGVSVLSASTASRSAGALRRRETMVYEKLTLVSAVSSCEDLPSSNVSKWRTLAAGVAAWGGDSLEDLRDECEETLLAPQLMH